MADVVERLPHLQVGCHQHEDVCHSVVGDRTEADIPIDKLEDWIWDFLAKLLGKCSSCNHFPGDIEHTQPNEERVISKEETMPVGRYDEDDHQREDLNRTFRLGTINQS